MYTVSVEFINKKTKEKKIETFNVGEIDSPSYESALTELSDLLYDLDVAYDDVEGDGDMVVDDMLISISELEAFEKTLKGRKQNFVIKGFEA